MSSEEERNAVFDAIQEWVHARDQVRGFSAPFKARTEAKRRGEMQDALNTFEQQIERRVLAQQPCYCAEALAAETRCAFHGSLCPCVTCKARQTQETGG